MRTRAILAGLILVCFAACGSSSPTEPSTATDSNTSAAPTGVQAAVVQLTNSERAREGLSALRVNAQLMHAAQLQADQNARYGRIDHVIPEAQYPSPADRLAAAGYAWSAYGENTAFGYADASAVVQGWMNSSGHRANIMGQSYTEIGVGYTVSANRPYYVQVFGRPR